MSLQIGAAGLDEELQALGPLEGETRARVAAAAAAAHGGAASACRSPHTRPAACDPAALHQLAVLTPLQRANVLPSTSAMFRRTCR